MSFDTKAVPPEAGASRIPFDSAVWQVQDTGDFIHTKTGEMRDEDGFLSAADDIGDEGSSGDPDARPSTGDPEDSGFDAGVGPEHDGSDTQVRPSLRAASADTDRPSKLAPRRRG